jgi:cytochrome c oxidase assembly protein subunit 11
MEINPLHKRAIRGALIAVFGMLMFSASFPYLYNVLCKATGLDGKALQAYEGLGLETDLSRNILLQFDSNPDKRRKIEFYPSTSQLMIHPGESYAIFYHLINRSSNAYIVQAIPSMAPAIAAKSLKKLECFCFQPQPLAPYEHRILPLRIVVDHDLPAHIRTMTLSYALFELKEEPLSP